jgi:two-component system cell cycle response regulator DivK
VTRVLLVEDNEMNRDMLSRRLRKKGFEVDMAIDGAEGVAMARRGGYEIVLMDMSLPVIDGWEATRQLRAAPETRDVPIIALTAHAMAGDRDRAMEAGCSDYDTKPVEIERLLLKMHALLDGPP